MRATFVPRGAVLVAAAAFLALAAPATATPSGWSGAARIVAASGGPSHSMAMDATGYVHVAMDHGAAPGIWYVTNDSGPWRSTRISSGDDHSPSLALDDGIVHIAFSRHGSADAGTFTATNATADWVVAKRHAGGDGAPSLDVRSGIEHVAVQSADHALLHLFGPADGPVGAWTTETVDGSCCTGRPSLRLTSTGAVRIAYPDGTRSHPTGLKLGSRGGGGWSSQVVDTHRTSAPSLVLDEGDQPDIAYLRSGAGTWYANKGSGPWGLRQLNPTSTGAPDIAVHSGSVAFIYGSHGKLTYATLSGGIIWSNVFSASGHDSKPEIERVGGRPYVIFDRTGTSSDGIYLAHQN